MEFLVKFMKLLRKFRELVRKFSEVLRELSAESLAKFPNSVRYLPEV